MTRLQAAVYRYLGGNGAGVAAETRRQWAGRPGDTLILADDPGRAFRRASSLTSGRRSQTDRRPVTRTPEAGEGAVASS